MLNIITDYAMIFVVVFLSHHPYDGGEISYMDSFMIDEAIEDEEVINFFKEEAKRRREDGFRFQHCYYAESPQYDWAEEWNRKYDLGL